MIKRLAEQLGVHPEALRNWIRQDEADHGERFDRPTTVEDEELRQLRKGFGSFIWVVMGLRVVSRGLVWRR
ncbi:transposase [Micromonospora sp. NPDC007271]|uniref:transposase n=1 Tax=Micromonospora sp. NPDC007271 TaxID=3154587 RepID=UPI003403BADD